MELDDLNLICKYAEMSGNLNLKAFEEKIISSNDPSLIVQFTMSKLVKEKTALIKTILKEDIKSKVSDYDLFKIYGLGGEDKEPIFDELLKRGDPKTLYDLALGSVGEKYKKIEQALIQTRNAEYIYRLATNQKEETNIKVLENTLLEIGDAYYLVGFAEDVEGADLTKIREVVYKNGTQEQVEYLNKILKKSVFEDMTEEDLEGVLGQL